jgi:histidinol phosphatase-like PHP family hydrolase
MKTYQAEMHCHTREVSLCSRIPAEYLIRGYAELGYRYVFITDHYHPVPLEAPWTKNKTWDELVDHFLSGYRIAQKAAEGTGVKVLLGMEAGLNTNPENGLATDFLVYGFDEAFLRRHPRLYNLSYSEFYDFMHSEGFIVFQAHPYRYGGEPVRPVCYDGIEIVNTHPRHFSRNQLAVRYAIDNGLYMIGGSDAHSEEDVGRGGVMLPDGIETPMDLVDFYRENGSPELIVTFGA